MTPEAVAPNAKPRAGWQQLLGAAAEELAARYLSDQGCRVLARRYRWRRGEIDLVVQDGQVIAFVEVKARRTRSYGSAAEAVTRRKQRRIVASARHYLRQAKVGPRPCRFDVVCIEPEAGRARITWMRDAFRP